MEDINAAGRIALKNNVYQPIFKSQANNSYSSNIAKDEFCFSEMYVDIKEDESFDSDRHILSGTINNNPAQLRESYIDDDNFFIEGSVGNKNLSIEFLNKKADKNTIFICNGKYDNKDLNVTLETDIEKIFKKTLFGTKLNNPPKNIIIKGTFDNKPVEFSIPNAEVPKNSDLKNIITIMLNAQGLTPQIHNGKIVSVDWKSKIWDSYCKRLDKQEQNKKENISPILQQITSIIISTIIPTLITLVVSKFGGKK